MEKIEPQQKAIHYRILCDVTRKAIRNNKSLKNNRNPEHIIKCVQKYAEKHGYQRIKREDYILKIAIEYIEIYYDLRPQIQEIAIKNNLTLAQLTPIIGYSARSLAGVKRAHPLRTFINTAKFFGAAV